LRGNRRRLPPRTARRASFAACRVVFIHPMKHPPRRPANHRTHTRTRCQEGR
jgi:hypothetical protein